MLRLKTKIERVDGFESVEAVAIANSGFVGMEPEILIPPTIARQLKLHEIGEPEIFTKVTGDGRRVKFKGYKASGKVYIITEDRVEGPVISTILLSTRGRYILFNDKLLSRLKIVLLDFGEGTWCFRDELGRKERKTF
ncbi:hypothetical protein CW703_06875 [Candidatus Bathyarchaeota archaeon]|nr:MAG: hypothetical protein CW703_06875 [Candidatus Bathyarchaeota archaeon]